MRVFKGINKKILLIKKKSTMKQRQPELNQGQKDIKKNWDHRNKNIAIEIKVQ